IALRNPLVVKPLVTRIAAVLGGFDDPSLSSVSETGADWVAMARELAARESHSWNLDNPHSPVGIRLRGGSGAEGRQGDGAGSDGIAAAMPHHTSPMEITPLAKNESDEGHQWFMVEDRNDLSTIRFGPSFVGSSQDLASTQEALEELPPASG